MSDSLKDILASKKQSEPVEFSLIRKFIHEKFNAPCLLSTQNGQIIITVNNSALAGSLQFEIHNLEKSIGSGKKLRIRIG